MNEKNFFFRLKKFGLKNLIISADFILAVCVGLLIGVFSNWDIPSKIGNEFIVIIIPVTAAFFAIILTALALISSFSDKEYILAWVRAGLFDEIIILFQWNLYIPLILILIALFLKFIYYHSILFIFLAAFFIYLIFSLMDLVRFISNYALQRADFIEIELENETVTKI